ncbi:hypothetical protein VHUM_03178 [Vanrija humicola]|uniref:SYO1-like TPR repeats domain-containing protein n=1 Tax=Vanrija humicola TaxID=5417 RepID=A0A7D8UZV2_VANHU|nr:hypothetical protein VHUM_03178 [Vanrija humicola]
MGKAQYKKKATARRHNPIRVPDAHLGGGKADGKANPEKEKQMLPVLQKLRSPDYADRTWACAAICNLVANDAATRRLFQGRNVVGELIERLSDSVDEVVVEASGALRNLAIDGGHELVSEMFNKGIMPHLTVLMGKIGSTVDEVLAADVQADSLSDEEIQQRKHILALAENVTILVWLLADANHKTLAAINSVAGGVAELLVKILRGREKLGLGVTLAAAQALYALTQDNRPFTNALLHTADALPTLVALAKADHAALEAELKAKAAKAKGKKKAAPEAEDEEVGDGRLLLTRVLVAGTLRNVVDAGSRTDESVGIAALTNDVILPLVNSLLDVNLANVVTRVGELVAALPAEDVPVAGKDLQNDHKSPVEVKLERLERMLTTVSIALEVLTGICAGLEDAEEEEMDEEDDAEMEDAIEDEALIAMGRDAPGEAGPAPTVKTTATLPTLLGALRLPERLSALAQLTPMSFPPTGAQPSLHPPTTAALSTLHLRALEALNNLLLTVAASLAGGADPSIAALIPAAGIWATVFGIISAAGEDASALTARGQEMRLEVLEAALGCAWGVSKVSADQLSPLAVQVQMLMDVLPALRSDAARTRALDTLAALASRPGVSVDENRAIGQWVLNLLPSANDEILVAVLNAVIDIYADEGRDYDRPVFVAGGFLDALASSVARVRADVRKIDRRKQPELRARAEEAYENLTAFVKYRRSLRL